YELDINVNIGIAIYPNDGEEIQELRNHAKIALIRAKKEGKNTYKFYSSDLDIQNYKEFVLRSDLHNALEEGQLKVYYQPIVNIKTNKILGTEALVRWEHPEWGLVESEEFISLAEDTGKIIDIGKWVLRRVCKDYKQWLVDGLADIKVSVNFSAVQFLEKDFVENIKKIIGEFDLAPNFLIMEITENILLANVEKANSDINRLRDMGIQIAMDDFGTGYSSLIYLNSFNIDIIKLDKSFIKNIPENIGSVAITKTVVKLAKELKLRFVAEGIETYDQLQLLKSLNAIGGQGFLYSEARPVEEFEKILRKRVCKPAAFLGLDATPRVERRKLFRVKFTQLLEADLTILEIKGKKINVGNTKVLVKDMGPGGLCFISNIRFPVERDMTLQFKTDLIGEEIVVYGHPVWTEQIDSKAHKYGIKFEVDENERMELVRVLNSVQIKMRKNVLFAEGSFFPGNHLQYFEAFQKSI
ncbi:MAG: GGDEF domain-containing phosphodiesterase, partial [Tissierellaceae bacterium]